MERIVDLHNHTPLVPNDYHDASVRPSDLVEAALAAGIDVLGVTDHSSVAYFSRLRDAAERMLPGGELLVVPGAEIKVRWQGDEAHLIVLLRPETCESDFASLQASLGMEREVPAELLPAVFVEADPCDVACGVVSLGGICFVAHADRWFGAYRLLGSPLLEAMAAGPLAAVEVLESHSADLLPGWATRLPLLRSSDAHSPSELGRRTTTLALDELSFEGLRRGLAAASAIAS